MQRWQNDGGAPEKLQARVRAQMGITEPLKPLEVADFEQKEPNSDQEWYVLIEGKPELRTQSELDELLKSMGGDTLIALKGSSEWKKAREIFTHLGSEVTAQQTVVQDESPEKQLLETFPTKELIAMALAKDVISADPGDGVDRGDLIDRMLQAGVVPE